MNELSTISIRPVLDIDDAHQIEDVQRLTWQMEDLEILPGRFLHALKHNGACLLGAYDGDKVVGFVFGLLGTVEDLKGRIDEVAAARLQMYSVIMGVLPEYQGQGLGYRLKLAQREWALGQGYELVTWTYDPLEAGNAVLNLGKLGAVCRCYLRDLYGEMVDGLNVGIPTDRFEVAWWIAGGRVRQRTEQGWQPPRLEHLLDEGTPVLNPSRRGSGGWPEPGPARAPDGAKVLVEIPSRFQALKAADLAVALAWRLSVRETCEAAFRAGYTACDVVRAQTDGEPRVYYLLERQA